MIEAVDEVVKNIAINACEIPLQDHMRLIWSAAFWSGLCFSMISGVVSYFGFRKNESVKANSITEAVFNLIRAIVQRIFQRGK